MLRKIQKRNLIEDVVKDKPRRDGSGKGIMANKGRGGCKTPRKLGKR